MLRKTRNKLVILNSLVFFIIINFFGLILFFYIKDGLYVKMDTSLNEVADHIKKSQSKDLFFELMKDRAVNRRLTILSWDQSGKFIRLAPKDALTNEEIKEFQALPSDGRVQTAIINGHYYRVRTITFPSDNTATIDGTQVGTLQFIYFFDSEQEMINSLLIYIEVGGLASGLVCIMIGLLLASRALIPIKLSWQKQQQFVSDTSHELRTPLSVIQLNLEQLLRHPDSTIEQESEKISVVINETKRLNKMISRLLTLTRSDSNQMQILPQKFRLDEMIDKIVQLFSELTELKKVRIETSIKSPIEVTGDKEQLYQLFSIILDNSLKHMHRQGLITIECSKNRNTVNITVKDTGIGISEEDLPFIFDRFFRGDKSRSSEEAVSVYQLQNVLLRPTAAKFVRKAKKESELLYISVCPLR